MTGTDSAPVLRLRPGVEWQPVDDEVVLLDVDAAAYLAVNNTGAVLWPLVARGATPAQLVEELTARFDVDPDRASVDVATFIEQLRSLTLVVDG